MNGKNDTGPPPMTNAPPLPVNTATPASPAFQQVQSDEGMSTTTLVVIIVASIVGFLAIVAIGVYLIRRRRRESSQSEFVEPPTQPAILPPPIPSQEHHVPVLPPPNMPQATTESNSHYIVNSSQSSSIPPNSNFYDQRGSYTDEENRAMHNTRFTELSTNSYASESLSFSGSIMSDGSRPYDSATENDIAWKYMSESERLRYLESKNSSNSLHDSEAFESFNVGKGRNT
ncbi:hypothetical protein THRCLA_11620 [Thraustotheca clavata]|uniref:Uncharacterized protein n=1 Tax=Thraustotheca clavata TaxID=74557 RepID=A0A1V9Y750_9STRA|nr:hypothetical protein THRCLA_11620 [Thraustotheca clavata]